MKNLLLLSLFLCANLIYPQTATAPSLGDGSSANPYQVATLNNLYWITASNVEVPSPTQVTRWSCNYIQTADINAAPTSAWFPDGSGGYYGWLPIATVFPYFTGTYNGQGHTISSLYIKRS
jgi:hypothetical protein